VPRRDDLHKILILGSGPIVIGQAAEFDYSGVQACKVLREEGYEVVLVNSNPATIMTDPEFADATYVEPLLPGPVRQIIARERPDALLPTLGGQTALNLAKALHEDGTLAEYDVELIGADYAAIRRAEDRDEFRTTMEQAGLKMPRSAIATTLAEADDAMIDIGLPIIVRPAYTLGGRGGGIARTPEEFRQIVRGGLDASPISQILLDESVIGWGEFELEVMRDHNDNCVIVCSIENVDPMGVHTGDSVTVAPQQTLPDRLYQRLRDQAFTVIRAVGVETGGSNVQFAVNPLTEEIMVIEMNPRVSRSSALASKATGFPIAKIAARLAVGYALEEIDNDITRLTPASFEPTIDYVVVKWPRFAFEKFAGSDQRLSTHMKSVGEAMAIGRTFQQAFAKAMRSRELDQEADVEGTREQLLARLERPSSERYDILLAAFRAGAEPEEVNGLTHVDLWFLRELQALALHPEAPFAGVRSYRAVDTCAAEFAAETPYFYSGWERSSTPQHEVRRGDRPSVVILGAGPNRIGQGIEFDYCCVHAAMTVRASGRDAVMINCNPETVSTDYDTSDRLYFEPLTLDDVLGVVEIEQQLDDASAALAGEAGCRAGGGLAGVIVQFGGQTPLKLAAGLQERGVPILGTSVDAIDLAEDRGRFGELLDRLGYKAPPYATAVGVADALHASAGVGFPLLVRPSYVLGGRAMEIVYDEAGLEDYLRRTAPPGADGAAASGAGMARQIFLDRFLENAIELDVDALCDGETVWIGGIMQHVEEAGIHSGDSACVLPPHSLGPEMLEEIRATTRSIALALGTLGLINIQYAVHGGELYVIEANPRASRTVPFVSKAIGVPLAKMACRIMLGERIEELGLPSEAMPTDHVSVKEAVLPFDRFAGSDALLGPEMRSTGEVMGIARDFPTAFAKAQAAAGATLPQSGTVFITVTDADKAAASGIAALLGDLGFRVVATAGTAQAIRGMGVRVDAVLEKIGDGSRPGRRGPNVADAIEAGDVDLIVNTPTGSGARADGWEIRRAAVARGIPCITTLSGGHAAARAIAAARNGEPTVLSLQEIHRERAAAASPPAAHGGSPAQRTTVT
jgi:carbamoyl-phosphate synthase large subunit